MNPRYSVSVNRRTLRILKYSFKFIILQEKNMYAFQFVVIVMLFE